MLWLFKVTNFLPGHSLFYPVLYSSRQKSTAKTIVTSNNLTIHSTLPFIDLTKLLNGKENSESSNRIDGVRRDLNSDAEWFQSGLTKDKLENIQADPLAFKGDNNNLESEETTTTKPIFDPNDPFTIYAFREPKHDEKGTIPRTTTSRTFRDVTRGCIASYPSSNYWVWGTNGGRNSQPYSPVSFSSSIPRL